MDKREPLTKKQIAARLLGSSGGKKRTEKYTKEHFAAWGKLGGRPKKMKDVLPIDKR